MTYPTRGARWVSDDAIDCEVNHPAFGWIPFTASASDPDPVGRSVFSRLASGESGPVDAYVPAVKDAIDIATEKERLIDAHILAALNARGYDGPHSIAKYQNLTDAQIASLPLDERADATRYRNECQAAALWITRVWIKANAVMAAVVAESRTVPSDAELIAELPAMVWPEG